MEGRYPTGPSLFIGCSGDYLRELGLPLLRSIASTGPGTAVHLHVAYRDRESLDLVLGLGLALKLTHTYEDPTAFIARHKLKSGEYYGSIRMIRFAEALGHSSGPLCMMDCDALMIGDPQRLLNLPADLAMRVRPGRLAPEHQFSACMIIGRPAALGYFQRVARIVKGLLLRNYWGFDQYALFSAWLFDRPDLVPLGPDFTDISDYLDNSVAWFTAGKAKFSLTTDQTAYARLFRQYRNALSKGP